MKCCGKAEETEKLLKDGTDKKEKPERRMEVGREAARPTGPRAGHAVQVSSSAQDEGAARRGSLMASMPGRSDWKSYDKRNMEVGHRLK